MTDNISAIGRRDLLGLAITAFVVPISWRPAGAQTMDAASARMPIERLPDRSPESRNRYVRGFPRLSTTRFRPMASRDREARLPAPERLQPGIAGLAPCGGLEGLLAGNVIHVKLSS